jgi:tetratricopeptide (TPR) repeat protein
LGILRHATHAVEEQDSKPPERTVKHSLILKALEILNTVIGSLIGLLIVALVVNTWIEARVPVTEIRSITLPKDWEERGDTRETVIQEVRKRSSDAISVLGRSSEFVINTELHDFDVDLSGNQISAKSLVHLWRDKFFHNRRILEGGVIAPSPTDWTLWVTLSDGAGKWRTTSRTLNGSPNRNQVLQELTELVLAASEQDVYAWLLVKKGKIEEMDRYFWKEVLDDDLSQERRANFWVVRALSLVLRKRPEEADDAFRQALHYGSRSRTNYYWAAMLKLEGRVDEAIDKYNEALKDNRDYAARANNDLGRIYFDRGDVGKATQYFLKAVQIDSQCFEAWNNLSAIEVQKKPPNWEKATELVMQSVTANPDYVPALANLCADLTVRGKPQDALPFCQRARELNPSYPPVLFNLRKNLESLGRTSEAMAVNDEILAILKQEEQKAPTTPPLSTRKK